jgi:TolB-like protein
MAETRKIAAILAADVVGFSRMVGADEDRTLARLRALRADVIEPIIAAQNGRVFKRTGDGALVEFRSVVEAVRSAISVQRATAKLNAGTPEDQHIVFRIGIHLGDVVEEHDGDLMGDGVNIAARLEGVAEPGGICLSTAAYEQVRDKLGAHFVDAGEQKLKNIARPVRVYAINLNENDRSRRSAAPEKSVPPRLSMVVLPFANIGGNAEQEHFVDGVTESLTTDLSRIRSSFVIGRNTAFTYKNKAVDLKQIGRELNVRYVLEGSVQRGGTRMRVNVQLVAAETGNHLWAERFDKPLADLFDMQDEIVARLAGALNAELASAEARRAEQAPNPSSMDLYFQGLAWFNKGFTLDNIAQARSFFDRSLAIDAGNVDALVALARADSVEGAVLFSIDPIAAYAAAETKLTNALSSAPDHAWAHMLLGFVEMMTKRAAKGIAECEHALALDRNLASAHSFIGRGKTLVGRAEETEAHVRDALRLSPRDTMANTWMMHAGFAKNHLGAWHEAVVWLRRAIEANRNHPTAWFQLASALARLGQLDEARYAVKAGLNLAPTLTVSRAHAAWTAISDDPKYLTQLEPILEGLRRAGLPEE